MKTLEQLFQEKINIFTPLFHGLYLEQANLTKHGKLFNVILANKHLFGKYTLLANALMDVKNKKRPQISQSEVVLFNPLFALAKVCDFNAAVNQFVVDWIDDRYFTADAALMTSLLADYPNNSVKQYSLDTSIASQLEISKGALQAIIDNSSIEQESNRIIKTGYDELDKSLDGGIEIGNMAILAGPTGSGKTSYAVNMCLNMTNQVKVAYLMSEQDITSIGRKFIGVLGRVRAKRMETNTQGEGIIIGKSEMDKLVNSEKLYIYTTKNRAKFTMQELIQVITGLANTGRKVFIIDNLSYIEPITDRRWSNYPDFIKNVVVPEINTLCSKLDIAIVLLAQVNNEVAKSRTMSITLNQIMGGQDSVQAAYAVITIHYPAWFINQQGIGKMDKELTRYSVLKAIKTRESSGYNAPQTTISFGDYIRSANEHEQQEMAILIKQSKGGNDDN